METSQGFLLSRQQKRQYFRHTQGLPREWLSVQLPLQQTPGSSAEAWAEQVRSGLAQLIAGLEILHTRFDAGASLGEPLQHLVPELDWLFQMADNDFQAAEELAQSEQHLVAQLRVNGAESVLHLSLSRWIADPHSMILLSHLLKQSLTQENIDWEAQVQYVDFAQWQDDVVAEDEAGQGFWQQQRLHQRQYSRLSALTRTDTQARALCRAALSLNLSETYAETRLLAAWLLILQRFTGSAEQCLDVNCDPREFNPAFAQAIGPYSEMLPCVFDLEEGQSGAALCAAIERQLPLVRQSQMSLPLTLEPAAAGYAFLYRTEDADRVQETPAGYLLHLVCSAAGEGARLVLNYDNDQLPQPLAESMLTALGVVLEHWQADLALAKQKLVVAPEHAAVASGPQRPLDAGDSFLQRFKACVAATPENIALKSHSAARADWTYQQLDQASERLASLLLQQGVQAGQRVALCFHHDYALLGAILAVMKLGCSYIAIDAASPEQRIQAMLEAAQFLLIGSDIPATPALDEWRWAQLRVDPMLSDLPAAQALPALNRDGEAVAYVLYTSGSTGQPKGVEISHAALINYLDHCVSHYLDQADGSVVHSPISFDLTLTALLAPLCCGKFVALAHPAQDLEALQQELSAHSGSRLLLKLTPAHLKALKPWFDALANPATSVPTPVQLACLIVGGEQLHAQDIAPVRRVWPDLPIINEYGPTEATVGCCIYACQAEEAPGAIAIGQPIANTQMLILSAQGQPLPRYCAGELYLAGAGLAQGYLGLPVQTWDKFIQLDLWGQGPLRVYRSGDVALLTDSARGFEFLGRNDDQVKIRGYRIELGDVSACLKQALQLEDAHVSVHLNPFNEAELIAYAQCPEAIGLEQMRAALAPYLPAYMWPSQMICLPRFPLTRHGKIDQAALPPPDFERKRQPYVAPRNRIESGLVQAWQTVLGLNDIGINDSFFALGGDSIRAVHAVSMINEAGYPLTADVLFQHTTVAELAAWIEQQQASQHSADSALLDALLNEVESMSEEEVAAQLAALEQETNPAQEANHV